MSVIDPACVSDGLTDRWRQVADLRLPATMELLANVVASFDSNPPTGVTVTVDWPAFLASLTARSRDDG